MTNKEFMCTLNTIQFESAMHTLYFNPKIWTNSSSTPNMFLVQNWLNEPYDSKSDFWKFVLE